MNVDIEIFDGVTRRNVELQHENHKLRAALRATISGMEHAERHYLSVSAAAEMWAHCNGYEGTPDARAALQEARDV